MMTKRVLFLIDALGAGGAERQLVYLLRGLDRTRYQPFVATIFDERVVPYHYADDLRRLDVPLLTLGQPAGLRGRLVGGSAYLRLMWTLRPQIVQGCIHHSNLITRAGRPLSPPHRLFAWAQQFYTERELRSERWSAWLCDHVIAAGEHVATGLIDGAKLPQSKVTAIPYAVDTAAFEQNPRPDLRAELLGGEVDGFLAVMVARVDPRKDHATLLEALRIVKDELPSGFKLVLVGDMSDRLTQARIDELLDAYDLRAWVIQRPATTEIAAYYHAADVCLLTSNSEAFPNVILEAGAAGKAMIVSEAANRVGVVRTGETGWQFPTGNAHALADCLRAVWRLPKAQLDAMGTQAQASAAQFSIESMARRFMALWEKGKA